MKCLICLCLLVISSTLYAQDNEEAAIRKVVDDLFTGMHTNDSAMVRSAFTHEVMLVTVLRNKNNEPVLRRETSLDGFLKAVGAPKEERWTEDIWNVTIQRDGDLASVWCEYAFYIGKKFSHCGVDAFHLHKTGNGWKIFHLADTRRTEGCAQK